MSQFDQRRGVSGGAEYGVRPIARPVPNGGGQGYADDMYAGLTESSPSAVDAARGQPRPQPDAGSEPVVIPFVRAYQNQGEEVSVVTLRPPTPVELKRFGYPARLVIDPTSGQVEGMDIVPARVAAYITALSAPRLLPSTVEAMDFIDFEACSGAIMGFFRR